MTRYARSERAQRLRDELANTLGRNRLYAFAYQDPAVLRGAFDAGYTVDEIAAALDVPVQTICRWMDRRDVESPHARGQRDAGGVGR